MVLEIGETRHPRKMHHHYEIGLKHGEEKFKEFEEETHSHNVYKKDRHHLKLKTGI